MNLRQFQRQQTAKINVKKAKIKRRHFLRTVLRRLKKDKTISRQTRDEIKVALDLESHCHSWLSLSKLSRLIKLASEESLVGTRIEETERRST